MAPRSSKATHWTSYGINNVRDVFRIRGKRIYQSPDRTISAEDACRFFQDACRFFQAAVEESH